MTSLLAVDQGEPRKRLAPHQFAYCKTPGCQGQTRFEWQDGFCLKCFPKARKEGAVKDKNQEITDDQVREAWGRTKSILGAAAALGVSWNTARLRLGKLGLVSLKRTAAEPQAGQVGPRLSDGEIREAMDRHGNNLDLVATTLGVSEVGLRKRLTRLGYILPPPAAPTRPATRPQAPQVPPKVNGAPVAPAAPAPAPEPVRTAAVAPVAELEVSPAPASVLPAPDPDAGRVGRLAAEVTAMNGIVEILQGLASPSRNRVLAWLEKV